MHKPNPFLPVERPAEERAHSKFSASGSERWLQCAASVELEAASPPSKDNAWSIEGVVAHSVYEALILGTEVPDHPLVTEDMLWRVSRAVQKVKALHKLYGGALMVEKRVWATFIHAEMFGTTDTIIAPVKPLTGVRTLHILDYKDGAGHIVKAEKNTQLIQYALSVAESYGWELAFDEVKLWILQPRAGDNWYPSWVVPMKDLRETWLPLWEKGVSRIERGGNKPFPGAWCHWCRAKLTCPAKNENRAKAMTDLFNDNPLTNGVKKNGFKEESKKGATKKESSWPRKIEDYEGEAKEETNFY